MHSQSIQRILETSNSDQELSLFAGLASEVLYRRLAPLSDADRPAKREALLKEFVTTGTCGLTQLKGVTVESSDDVNLKFTGTVGDLLEAMPKIDAWAHEYYPTPDNENPYRPEGSTGQDTSLVYLTPVTPHDKPTQG